MKKRFLLLAGLAGLLVLAGACGQSQPEVSQLEVSQPHEEGEFRVEVSRNGFNGIAGEFLLEVEAGQEVEITFVYDDGDFSQNNPHIIAIPAYGIETAVIDEDNPEVTVRFTASEAGEVSFTCTKVDCVGHSNLLGGIIEVHSGH